MEGYAISAQKKSMGKPTTGGSPTHAKMKFGIPKGKGPADSGAATNNKKMYKASSSNSGMNKSSY